MTPVASDAPTPRPGARRPVTAQDIARLAEAIALVTPDAFDHSRVIVRYRSDTGELLVRLRVAGPDAKLVCRWRRWAPHESGRSAVRALELAGEAVRAVAASGSWDGWAEGQPPYLPFLHTPPQPRTP